MKIQKRFLFIIFTLIFIFTLGACAKRSTGSGIVQYRMGTGVKTEEEAAQEPEETEAGENTAEPDLYIITKIDTGNKTADFQNVRNGRQLQYEYDTGTRFLDKFGDSKSASSFLPGDVAEIKVSGSTNQLETVQLSDEVWVYDDIVNYSVDENTNAITIGQSKYSYDPQMDIFSGEGKVGFASVGDADVLRAVGIGKKLISLSVTKGHGYLALANTKIFEGSFICVGDKIFEEVTQNMQIEVPEGTHLVTVANNGYGGSREVVIERNQTTSLNLDELKGEGPKICTITFAVGIEGAVLRIDGKKADYSKPVEVAYGIHTVSVEAEGYDTITEKLVVNSKEAEIEIALTASSGNTASEDSKTEQNNNTDSNTSDNTNQNSNTGNNTNSSNNTDNTNNNTSGSGNSSGTNNDSSQTDYLTTLYNLLTSINNTNNNTNSNSGNTNSTSGDSYDDLRDQ